MDLRDGLVWTGLIWLRIRTMERCCEHGKPSSSIQIWEFLLVAERPAVSQKGLSSMELVELYYNLYVESFSPVE
jgi:hypothetical protein